MAQKVMATSKNKQKLLLKKIPFLSLCFNIQIYISNSLLPLGGDWEHAVQFEIHYKKVFHLDQTIPIRRRGVAMRSPLKQASNTKEIQTLNPKTDQQSIFPTGGHLPVLNFLPVRRNN